MLVLTRKLHEQISIGQDITITVLRLKGNTVRIGIEAPQNVRVVRGELPRHETSPDTTKRSNTTPVDSRTLPHVPSTTARRGRSSGLRPIFEKRAIREREGNVEMRGVTHLAMVAE